MDVPTSKKQRRKKGKGLTLGEEQLSEQTPPAEAVPVVPITQMQTLDIAGQAPQLGAQSDTSGVKPVLSRAQGGALVTEPLRPEPPKLETQSGSSVVQPPTQSQQQTKKAKKKKGKTQQPAEPSTELGVVTVSQSRNLQPPVRPGFGTVGKPISLVANHFDLNLKKNTIYHYDVTIKDEKGQVTARPLIKKLVKQFMETTKRLAEAIPVFDGSKNLYTANEIVGLKSKEVFQHTFVEEAAKESRVFKIEVQPTGDREIDVSAIMRYSQTGTSNDQPMRPIQALEIALNQCTGNRKIAIGHCLLSKTSLGQNGPVDIGGGVEVWFGHFQSVNIGWKKLFLNVDAAQRAFVKGGPVYKWMYEVLGKRENSPLSEADIRKFSKKIATLKVTYPRGKYNAKIGVNGLKGAANREVFECEGRKVTVEKYFREKYNIRLTRPDLPCIWVGSKDKKNLVPMEICTLEEGQEYRHKLSDIQTSKMIKVAATPAAERRKKIEAAVKDMNLNSDKTAQAFGVSIDSCMTQVKGRVLPAPTLIYGTAENECVPRDGSWNMIGLKFIDAKCLKNWGIISIAYDVDERSIDNFARNLFSAGSKLGMQVERYSFIKCTDINELENIMRMAKQKFPTIEILFVIINRKGDPAYEIVKRVGDLDLQLTTQCIQSRNVKGRQQNDGSYVVDSATMANICMKLNAKLGGTNNLISRKVRPPILLKEQVMIMGADVTHPGPEQGDSGKPSIAAVVGSVDPRAFRYATEIRIQKSRQEYIEDMEGMVYNLLLKFNRITGSTSTGKPQRIIFYRDGVSDGQFVKVMEWELKAIRKACLRLEKDWEPPITFLVVQKRHHTRLFAQNPRDQVGKAGNVPPGTVVDTDIVHPTENDFFLVSHFGIQGTSRPTHYHTLWDDSNFTSDELQILTYYLCYMFSRCTRSVSYPAPCYYSHLVAFRGRQYHDSLTRQDRGNVGNTELQAHIDKCRDLQFMFFV